MSVLDNPEYQDYRAEANLHLQKRTECLQKAAAARKKGMGDVSIYYTQLVSVIIRTLLDNLILFVLIMATQLIFCITIDCNERN